MDNQKVSFLEKLGKQAVDVVIDFVAAPYWEQNIRCLKTDGRLVLLAALGGTKLAQFNLAHILLKRLHIMGSTLRSRDLAYQIKLKNEFWSFCHPLFEKKALKPIIDSVWDWKEVKKAHKYMENNQNMGKIVLKVS